MNTKARRCRKLTPEQKKKIWAQTETNAGAGWDAEGSGDPPRRYVPSRQRDSEQRLDEIYKVDEL